MSTLDLAPNQNIIDQELLMSQTIPTGYIPPGQPRGKFFWASESRPPGQIFLSNSLPRGKKCWSNCRGWGKIFPNSKKLLLKLAKKSLKSWENYETVQLFYLENLKKPLCFRPKQNNSKIFKYSGLDIQLEYSVLGRCSLKDSFVIYKSLVCIQFLQIIVIFPGSSQTFTWGESQNPGGGGGVLLMQKWYRYVRRKRLWKILKECSEFDFKAL